MAAKLTQLTASTVLPLAKLTNTPGNVTVPPLD
jgi:hypothetical protein